MCPGVFPVSFVAFCTQYVNWIMKYVLKFTDAGTDIVSEFAQEDP